MTNVGQPMSHYAKINDVITLRLQILIKATVFLVQLVMFNSRNFIYFDRKVQHM